MVVVVVVVCLVVVVEGGCGRGDRGGVETMLVTGLCWVSVSAVVGGGDGGGRGRGVMGGEGQRGETKLVAGYLCVHFCVCVCSGGGRRG